jgi:hypothetical protein
MMQLFLAFALVCCGSMQAQDWSNNRIAALALSSDTIHLDTLSVVPGSVRVMLRRDVVADTNHYRLDYAKSLIIWNNKPAPDSLFIEYRVFSFNFNRTYNRRPLTIVQPEELYKVSPLLYRDRTSEESIFGSTELSKTGSISRGVGFGNNQNLTVNSTLSLQLSGKLNERISILASITDDNIPIQPDGNTALLQEFDQVYIQLYDDKSKLIAGDFFIQRPIGYFTTYYKRAQGASFSTKQSLGTGSTKFFTETSAAASRGKFARNLIIGQEGNQGPYRLRGGNNEFFIIVLAGTERVFIDGLEMRRGQEHDYIIDYNTAEITFTARQLINKDKRIAVEFQYTDANYFRSMLQTSTGVESDKFKLYLNFFSEQDSKNQPLQQNLSDADQLALSLAGNDPQNAIVPSYQQVAEFNNEQVLYNIVDSLGYDTVFVRALAPGGAVFQVSFSEVDAGTGDYIQNGFDATGRIFLWIAPDTVGGFIVRNGTHAPVRQLVAPRRNQILMAGGSYKLSKRTTANAEIGFSNSDQNLFSDLDNEENVSYGLMAQLKHEQPLSNNPKPLTLTANGMIEAIDNNFQPIEPYRSVEFNRDWNLPIDLLYRRQEILTAGLALRKEKKLDMLYSMNSFNAAAGQYKGFKNVLNADASHLGFDLWFRGSLLETSGVERSRFIRHRSRIEKSLKITKLGFEDEREDNRKYLSGTDSLAANAYRFYDWQVYLTNIDTGSVLYKVFYRERTDFGSLLNEISESTHATHYGAELGLIQNPKNSLKLSASNRVLKITNPELTAEAPESTLLSRLDYNLRLAKNSILFDTYYELGSGLERRQEFVYLADPTGQGPFTWIDYNNNGLKELNEFELARPEDGDRYIRISTPTDTYEKAYNNQFSQTINLQPAGAWMNKSGIRKAIARFSNQTAFRIQRRTKREEGVDRYNPFAQTINDSTLISQSSSLRNTIFFNRTSSKYGVDYTYSNQLNKNPLTSGFEARKSLSHALRVRYNLTAIYSILLENEIGTRKSSSDFIEGRDFEINYFSLKQTFSYQPGTNFRLSLTSNYTEKENELNSGGETASIVDLGIDCRYNKLEAGTLYAQLNLINIKYNAEVNNSLAYEMLEGLQNGQNFTWGMGIQRTLGNNLQLNLSYNGRKSEELKSVHTGNVQVRAFF